MYEQNALKQRVVLRRALRQVPGMTPALEDELVFGCAANPQNAGSSNDHHRLTMRLMEALPGTADAARRLLEPVGWWQERSAERAGAVEWFTPRSGQKIAWRCNTAGGKRQWIVAAPAGMDIQPREWKETFHFENVSYRKLFHRGGPKDFRLVYVIDGVGTDTLSIRPW